MTGAKATRYSCGKSFGIMILKINFEVSRQVLENKNLAKLMSTQGIWKEFLPFCSMWK